MLQGNLMVNLRRGSCSSHSGVKIAFLVKKMLSANSINPEGPRPLQRLKLMRDRSTSWELQRLEFHKPEVGLRLVYCRVIGHPSGMTIK